MEPPQVKDRVARDCDIVVLPWCALAAPSATFHAYTPWSWRALGTLSKLGL